MSPSRLGSVADNELTLIQKFVSTLIFAFAAIASLVFDSPTLKRSKCAEIQDVICQVQ